MHQNWALFLNRSSKCLVIIRARLSDFAALGSYLYQCFSNSGTRTSNRHAKSSKVVRVRYFERVKPMYNIGKNLSGGVRNPNFKKLVVRKYFPEVKVLRTMKKSENHWPILPIREVCL